MEYLDDSDVLSVRRDRDTVLDDPDLHPMGSDEAAVLGDYFAVLVDFPPLRVLPTGFLPDVPDLPKQLVRSRSSALFDFELQ